MFGEYFVVLAFLQQQKFGNWFWIHQRAKQLLRIWKFGKN